MITFHSQQVELYTRRHFAYATQIVEFFQSYEQDYFEPSPQYLWASTYPIDITSPPSIVWSLFDDHDTAGITLNQGDFFYNADASCVMVRRATGITQSLLIGSGLRTPIFAYAPRGFRMIYAAGYPISTPPSSGYVPDPLDDYGVVQVPDDLKELVATKVAEDYKNDKKVTRWSKEEIAMLQPYKKKDMIF
jgi:hypothetical protein